MDYSALRKNILSVFFNKKSDDSFCWLTSPLFGFKFLIENFHKSAIRTVINT